MFMPIGDEVPIKILPIVNLILIVTCAIVFLYQLSLPPWQAEALLRGYGMTPGVLLEDGMMIGLGETMVRYTDPAAAMLVELEGRLAEATLMVTPAAHGAVTVTRPAQPRALVAATPRTIPPASRARARRISPGVIAAALVAVVALALLLALLAGA